MFSDRETLDPLLIQAFGSFGPDNAQISTQELANPILEVEPKAWPDVCVEVGRGDESVLLAWLDELIETRWTPEATLMLFSKVCQCFSIFQSASRAESFGFELRKMNQPICPNFHVDKIDFRLVCALAGPGPEVLDANDVSLDYIDQKIVKIDPHGGRVLPTLQPQLLRGWKAYELNSVEPSVHRSPAYPGWRYLLRMDEIF